MNLFDKLVDQALKNNPNLASLRSVVEKELLHHDILRVMRDNALLARLTFIGGTCLRCCYGGIRLSEDLDFTGGSDFTRKELASMGKIIKQNLQEKYGFVVTISEPEKDKQNVDTWKIKIETRPGEKHMPVQRINIDICAVPSYEKLPMMLANPYLVEMGTSGLIIQAQSREEIYTDKLIAFALRPNRIKYRDLWDIMWLHSQGIKPKLEFVSPKLHDRHQSLDHFLKLFNERVLLMKEKPDLAAEFNKEMQRFLPVEFINTESENQNRWNFICHLMSDLGRQIRV
jgi:predicted nucleotidyltransferase component of viral defense system